MIGMDPGRGLGDIKAEIKAAIRAREEAQS